VENEPPGSGQGVDRVSGHARHSRIPPLQVKWRFLRSPWVHFWLGMFLAVAWVVVWSRVHDWSRASYDNDTEPAVLGALRQYQVVWDASQGRLLLQQSGREFRVADEPEPGSLGIGRLSAVRGVLVDSATRVEHYNQKLRERGESWRALWRPKNGDVALPLGLVGLPAMHGEELRLRKEDWDALSKDPVIALWQLHAQALRAQVRSTVTHETEAGKPSGWEQRVALAPTDEARAAVRLVAAVADDAIAKARKVAGPLVVSESSPQTSEQQLALRNFFLQWFRTDLEALRAEAVSSHDRLRRLIGRLAGCQLLTMGNADAEQDLNCRSLAARLKAWEAPEFKLSDSASIDEATELVRRSFNDVLQRCLYAVTLSETGFLWFFGAWKWWEIVWWTWFGVLAMAIFQISNHVVFGHGFEGRWFDSREGLRVIGRLFYAPLLAVVFFWLALATKLVDESSVLASNTFGSLAAAFLIGMIPNHLMRLLLKTAQAMLHVGQNPERPDHGAPPPRAVVPRTPMPPEGTVPTLSDLRLRLTGIATKPLE